MVDVSRLHDRPFPTIPFPSFESDVQVGTRLVSISHHPFLLSKNDVQVGTRTSEAQFRILVMQTYDTNPKIHKKHTDAKKLTFIITASYLSIP